MKLTKLKYIILSSLFITPLVSIGQEYHPVYSPLYQKWALGEFDNEFGQITKLLENPDKTDSQGNTALHIAVLDNHVDLAMLLVAYGADVNIQNNDGLNPFMLALLKTASNPKKSPSHTSILLHLLGWGADPLTTISRTTVCKTIEKFSGNPLCPFTKESIKAHDILSYIVDSAQKNNLFLEDNQDFVWIQQYIKTQYESPNITALVRSIVSEGLRDLDIQMPHLVGTLIHFSAKYAEDIKLKVRFIIAKFIPQLNAVTISRDQFLCYPFGLNRFILYHELGHVKWTQTRDKNKDLNPASKSLLSQTEELWCDTQAYEHLDCYHCVAESVMGWVYNYYTIEKDLIKKPQEECTHPSALTRAHAAYNTLKHYQQTDYYPVCRYHQEKGKKVPKTVKEKTEFNNLIHPEDIDNFEGSPLDAITKATIGDQILYFKQHRPLDL